MPDPQRLTFTIPSISKYVRVARTYGYAAASDGVLALTNFSLLFVLGARFAGPTVASYLLMRRAIAVGIPAISLGMHLALVRHLVLMSAGGLLVLLALAPIAIGGGMLAFLALLVPERVTSLALGDPGYGAYALPIVVSVVGVALTTVGVGLLRGRQLVAGATTLLICSLGVIPLVAAAIATDLPRFLYLAGGTQALFAGCVIAVDLAKNLRPERFEAGSILAFGSKAMLSEIVMMTLLWLPPVTIAHSKSVAVSGSFSLTLSLAIILASPVAPVATSLMPQIARAFSEKNLAELRRQVAILALLAVAVGGAMVTAGSVAYDFIVAALLADTEPLGKLASLAMIATTIPLAFYYSMRNIIDVVWSPLRNSIILFGGASLFVLVYQALNIWAHLPARVDVILAFNSAIWFIAAVALAHGYMVLMGRSGKFEKWTAESPWAMSAVEDTRRLTES